MPDYASLCDAETWAFIRRTESFYPPDTASRSIADQRAVYDAMCAAFHRARPAGVTTLDRSFGGVPCRVYSRGEAALTLLYLHGGGFVVGGLESHDDVCAEICAATGLRVVSVDYRLAPEHVHPASFEDALAAARAVAAEVGALILAGDSAGGSLAASVAHAARGELDLRGVVLVYPGLGGDPDRGSYLTHAEAPMLSREDVLFYAQTRHGGEPPAADPTAEVLKDSDFSGLPPTFIVTAECDPLSDDGREYRDRIVAAGGVARWTQEPGLVHGYLRARHDVGRARESFARIVAAISDMAKGDFHA
ncbi:alpha/beta hydrolase [Cereibacter changlensis]|uniref:Alpha/beta hydrolase n=1 Tax=Cereibacter changlensis TaxID=402884 RepID=A0A4U0YXI4_9RHOB|nr:alpha/beta hydrolase [Cereibacter changlensis]TKA97540.1 alpha/beta hydrolase [Cereibacter changlensis]